MSTAWDDAWLKVEKLSAREGGLVGPFFTALVYFAAHAPPEPLWWIEGWEGAKEDGGTGESSLESLCAWRWTYAQSMIDTWPRKLKLTQDETGQEGQEQGSSS